MVARAIALLPLVATIVSAEPTRTTMFRGRLLTYEVVDGLAVHAGDMILGTAAEAAAAAPGSKQRKAGSLLEPRAAAPHPQEDHRWPDATVPYVIDEGFSFAAVATIQAAVEEWNTKTVATLVPRTTEEDHVRFTPWPACSSQVGLVGGAQVIHLDPTSGCNVAAAIHEIGHTVGLYHEHQRLDRDEHLAIRSNAIANWPQYRPEHPGSGPYDLASVMHYTSPHMETIPPGMPIRTTGGLSPGDIDGVARMYGQTAAVTTISTNPPGLEIVIDGIQRTTPVMLAWAEGSVHTLAAPTQPQVRDGTRYLFGRWNDHAPRFRSVTTRPAQQTWFEANFIVQRQVTPSPWPAASGAVSVSPATHDGWHTIRSEVQWSATPNPGMRWLRWHDGLSTITRTQAVTAAYSGPPVPARAYFTASQIVRIEPTAGPIRVSLDGYSFLAPTAVTVNELGGTANISVPEVQDTGDVAGRRYRFEGWADGTPAGRTVDLAAAAGTTLQPQVSVEHHATTRVNGGGTIALDPPSADGWYPAGTTVQVTATAAEGWIFARWSGEPPPPAPREPALTITMDAPRLLAATFSRTPTIPPAGTTVTLPSFGEARGYRIEPPPDATALTVAYTAAAGANVDLYVKALRPGDTEGLWTRVFWYLGWSSWNPAAEADFRSESPGNSERVVISATSDPPLDHSASYYVSLVTSSFPRAEISGSLQLEVTRRLGPAPPRGQAWPRALSFVGPLSGTAPPAQVVTLTNAGGSDMNFQATPVQGWLAASPPAGTIIAGDSAQVTISALPVGVCADTHNDVLTISRSGTDGVAIAPLEIPVAFAAY